MDHPTTKPAGDGKMTKREQVIGAAFVAGLVVVLILSIGALFGVRVSFVNTLFAIAFAVAGQMVAVWDYNRSRQ